MMPQVPAKIGPCEFLPHGITLWGADAKKWEPLLHYPRPASEPLRADPETVHTRMKQAEILPISHLPDSNFIPKHYIVHMHSQKCTCCGREHTWSQIFAYNDGVSRMGFSHFAHLVPVDRFRYNVPVSVQAVKPTIIPTCHVCSTLKKLDLSHLPRPIDTAEYQRKVNLDKESSSIKPTGASNSKSAPKSTKKPLTINDLF
jgi:hypothetical protein